MERLGDAFQSSVDILRRYHDSQYAAQALAAGSFDNLDIPDTRGLLEAYFIKPIGKPVDQLFLPLKATKPRNQAHLDALRCS